MVTSPPVVVRGLGRSPINHTARSSRVAGQTFFLQPSCLSLKDRWRSPSWMPLQGWYAVFALVEGSRPAVSRFANPSRQNLTRALERPRPRSLAIACRPPLG